MSVMLLTKPNNSLGQFEQLVLTAVVALRDDAYGLAIQGKVTELYNGKPVNLGSVYVTLDRLEDKGFVESWFTEPLPERGGRSRRCFGLLPLGDRALKESVSIQKRSHEALAAFWRLGKWKPSRAK